MHSLKETALTIYKAEQDKMLTPNDSHILLLFGMNGLISHKAQSNQPQHAPVPLAWLPPTLGFCKLSFDGVSRGNPGPAGLGGIIRNDKGEILHIFWRALGEATNNGAEFAALEQGLQILIRLGKGSVIVEGDYLLDITAAKRIQNGTRPEKVTKHWRLAMITTLIVKHLSSLSSIVPQAVRWKANVLVDCLANHAVDHPMEISETFWQDVTEDELRNQCTLISRQDLTGELRVEDELQDIAH